MTSHPYFDGVAPEQTAPPDKAEYLAEARAVARHLAASRQWITADDIHEVCPVPAGIDPRILGSAFPKSDGWIPGNYVASRRKINHKRPVRLWRLP